MILGIKILSTAAFFRNPIFYLTFTVIIDIKAFPVFDTITFNRINGFLNFIEDIAIVHTTVCFDCVFNQRKLLKIKGPQVNCQCRFMGSYVEIKGIKKWIQFFKSQLSLVVHFRIQIDCEFFILLHSKIKLTDFHAHSNKTDLNLHHFLIYSTLSNEHLS